jgi:hypothetical protein
MRWLRSFVVLVALGCGGGGSGDGSAGTGGSGTGGSSGSSTGGAAGNAGVAGTAGTGSTAGSGGTAGAGGTPTGACQAVNMPPPTFTPEPELSDDAATEAHVFIRDYLDTHDWSTATQADAEIVRTAVSAAPHVHDSGIGTDCAVWVRFVDGTSSTIMSDRPGFEPNAPDPLEEPPPYTGVLPAPSGPVVKTLAGGPYALPESAKAMLGVVDNLAPHALPKIMAALTKRGYEVEPYPKLKFADLRLAVNVGVLWISSHGYPCPSDTGMHYCISTDDLRDQDTGKCAESDAACTLIRSDGGAGRTGGFYSTRADGTTKYWFGLNETFVTQYMKFAKNAVVFLDSCSSMNALDASVPASGADPAPLFRQALFSKGAGVVLGWRNVVNAGFAEKAATFFFDRALGANQQWPMSPPQRPFSVAEVYQAMGGRNLINDPNTIASLMLTKATVDDVILAPSIRNLEIGNGEPNVQTNPGEKKSNTEQMIYGQFGSRPAEVRIAGTSVSPDSGKSDSKKLVFAIPGNLTTGLVDVRVPTGLGAAALSSNSTPLTKWSGTARFKEIFTTLGTPGPYNELNCSKVNLRADIHKFRMAPETDAKPGRTDGSDAFIPEVGMRNSMADTLCNGKTGGAGTIGELTTSFGVKDVAVEWREAGDEPGKPTHWYVVNARLNTTNPDAIAVTLFAANKIYTAYTQTYPEGSTTVQDVASNMLGAIFAGKLITMDAGLGIVLPNSGPFTTIINDKGEIEVNIKPVAGTAPTSDTEG